LAKKTEKVGIDGLEGQRLGEMRRKNSEFFKKNPVHKEASTFRCASIFHWL
jgi:hypothetical protein